MATRQNSSNGNPKSPRIQVVLPEEMCRKLSELAEQESRTVSNMAKVLIQQGLKRIEETPSNSNLNKQNENTTQKFLSALEAQEPKRLKGAPKKIKFLRG